MVRYDYGGIWVVSSNIEQPQNIVFIDNATEALITYKETETTTAVLNPTVPLAWMIDDDSTLKQQF